MSSSIRPFVPRARALAAAIVLTVGAAGCGGTEAAESIASCTQGDLVAQCPPASNPIFEASAVSQCEGEGDFTTGSDGEGMPSDGASGHVEGQCQGSGDCKILCQFDNPCECGVEEATKVRLKCKACLETAACGNEKCEGGESVETCPQDCGCACENGKQRCNGDALQVCESCHWTELACPTNEGCRADPEEGATCQRIGI